MRSKLIVSASVLLGFFAGAPAALGATLAPAVPLPACPTAVDAAAPADGVRLLTRTQRRGRWHAQISTVDPAGVISPGLKTSGIWRSPNRVRAVFNGDGMDVAYERGQPSSDSATGVALAARGKRRPPTVSVDVVAADGSTTTQLLSAPGRRADLDEITTGGGATAITFDQSVPGKAWLQTWIAVRPAGATRFRPAVSLKSRLRDRFSDDEVYLGADGSGVVVSEPMERHDIIARPILRSGRVGRALTAFPGAYPRSTAAIGPVGEIVVTTIDGVRTKRGVQAGLFISTLTRGAKAFTKPRLLGSEPANTSIIEEGMALAFDSAGDLTALSGREYAPGTKDEFAPSLVPYRGRGEQLVQGPGIPALGFGDPVVLTPLAGNRMVVTWQGLEVLDAVRDITGRGQYAAFRGPDGSWGAPIKLSPQVLWVPGTFVADRGSTALPSGGFAMVYSVEQDDEPVRCTLVRATP